MIEKLNLVDIDRVMEIWLDTNLASHDFIDKDYFLSNFAYAKDEISKAEVYVYKEDFEIIAFIGLVDRYIAGIFVDDKYQNKGIGSMLLSYVKGEYTELTLNVYEDNKKAVDFYLKKNFKIVEELIDKENKVLEYTMKWSR